MSGKAHRHNRRVDVRREAAFEAVRTVHSDRAYAHLVLPKICQGMSTNDAAFITELVNGTLRYEGSYDRIIVAASSRKLSTLQPAVIDILRLACHEIFFMKTPPHAVVNSFVNVAIRRIGTRVSGVVNAIIRRINEFTWDEWIDRLGQQMTTTERIGFAHAHPTWIVEAIADSLGSAADQQLEQALAANNKAPIPMLAIRPGVASRDELIDDNASMAAFSPWGVQRKGNPSDLVAIREGRAGVQDEGSQLVILAAIRAAAEHKEGPWLDCCAGPGGKSSLLAGLAPQFLLSSEFAFHRAHLVAQATRVYHDRTSHQVICADATLPAWKMNHFALSVADVPCSGIGALRRRAEARWVKNPSEIAELIKIQRAILRTAIESTCPGGIVAYITCSPHRAETVDIVTQANDVTIVDAPSYLDHMEDVASDLDSRFIQLWPHRHGSDAMFCALLRKNPRG